MLSYRKKSKLKGTVTQFFLLLPFNWSQWLCRKNKRISNLKIISTVILAPETMSEEKRLCNFAEQRTKTL